MLRTRWGRNLNTRLTPTLEFIADAIPENAASIDALLRESGERGREARAQAGTAEYAGDAPNPYVTPRDEDGLRRRGRRGR